MLGSAVLDTVIGLSFVYFLVAALSSTVAEWLANLLRKRAKYLLRGVAAMLSGDKGSRPLSAWTPASAVASIRTERELYRTVLHPSVGAAYGRPDAASGEDPPGRQDVDDLVRLMRHPLLRARRQTDPDGRYTRLPPYLPANDIAAAVIDVLLGDPPPAGIGARIEEIAKTPVGRALKPLWEQAGEDRERFVAAIEGWYDAQMERVSGWYKRWVKRWIIAIGVVVAVVLNVNTVSIASALYDNVTVRDTVVAAAGAGDLCGAPGAPAGCTRDELDRLAAVGLPLGWPEGCPADIGACVRSEPGAPVGVGDWLAALLGLALTVIAAAVGAPFWFDVLGRLGSLRNTGTPPKPAKPAS